MPNFKKNPDGMKPSGFKMKNQVLNASARTGSPMQANYGGGESPTKFIGGLASMLGRGGRRSLPGAIGGILGSFAGGKRRMDTSIGSKFFPRGMFGSKFGAGDRPNLASKAMTSAQNVMGSGSSSGKSKLNPFGGLKNIIAQRRKVSKPTRTKGGRRGRVRRILSRLSSGLFS